MLLLLREFLNAIWMVVVFSVLKYMLVFCYIHFLLCSVLFEVIVISYTYICITIYMCVFYCVIWTRKDANINSDSLDFFSFLFVFSFLSMKYSIISQQISLSELKHFLSMLYILSNEWFLPVYYPLKGNFKSCIV